MSMPESDIFPQIVPRNDEVINTDKEDSVEDQVYELVISSNGDDKEKFAKNKAYDIHHVKRKKKTFRWILIIGVVVAIILFSACIAIHCKQHTESMPSYRRFPQITDQKRTSNTSLKSNASMETIIKYVQKDVAFVQAVAIGARYVTVEKDQRFSFWKLQKKSSNIAFKSMTFIVVQRPGVYQVYAQMTYKPNGVEKSTSFLLMRNNVETLSRCSVTNCVEVCTMYTSKLVTLKKGDYLFLKAAKKGEFVMDRELTYFGAVLL